MAGYDQGIWVNYFAVTAHEADVSTLRRLGFLLASRPLSPALRAYAALAQSADKGAVREI
ncbi:hypothetical protein ABGB18_36735 [Nonomuraea sp. B12E4]|uniref:hypothetical protein n=1 Tax=Nonomuraea sp. B12E4 TaxID=3153564 RepID=UPI00325C3FD3